MGAIRERMLAELDLLGMSEKTKQGYVGCCRVFVAYFMKSPEQMGEREIREFLLYLVRDRRASPSSIGVYVAAIRFLYRRVLRNPDVVADLPRPRIPKKLPSVPNQEEVSAILNAIRSPKYRAMLTAVYGAGLRISEASRTSSDDRASPTQPDGRAGRVSTRGGSCRSALPSARRAMWWGSSRGSWLACDGGTSARR